MVVVDLVFQGLLVCCFVYCLIVGWCCVVGG